MCGKYLIHNGKEISKEYFSKTAWEVFIEKIEKMSVSDMNVQKEYIRMAITRFFQETDAIMKIMSIL